ncbi:E1 ubiquitin-activating protein uba2 [Microbotryomycetes sp. JL201]|nr:E1 ubiquitin-activating protein uba2 [Microbotryomycetes sp. JL201]
MAGLASSPKGVIELLDLDTIDLSNLNRQFLFQKQHVKRPKAVVARETALKFNPEVHIKALHRNIKDAEFDVDYFKSFDFVMNALDNIDARRHVNKMCMAADVPAIESGTEGYRGQVEPIKKDVTECYDCTSRPVPKTFAVCTIRSTPSTAHHCIAWAKSYLFPQLFGADDENEGAELDDAEKNGENADEIQELRKEAAAIRQLRASLTGEGAAKRVFEKVYSADIERLLKMEDMWKHRKPPHTLSFDTLQTESLKQAGPSIIAANGAQGLKDQRSLSLVDSFELFLSSMERLSKRIDPSAPLSFDKDDDDTLDFVTAAANLRASAFDIESQTRFQVKEYAGNIIPAIATTNAIIAGLLVLQALNVLRSSWEQSRMMWLSRQPNYVVTTGPTSKPNPQCAVCRVVYVPVQFKEDGITLDQFIKDVVFGKIGLSEDGHIIVREGSRILFETEDLEENAGKSLKELGLVHGTFVTVVDDDESDYPVQLAISSPLAADAPAWFKINGPIPSPLPRKAPPPVPANNDDDDDEIVDAVTSQAALAETADAARGPVVTGQKRSADDAELKTNGGAKKGKMDSDDIVIIDEDESGTITID